MAAATVRIHAPPCQHLAASTGPENINLMKAGGGLNGSGRRYQVYDASEKGVIVT